MDNHIHAMDNHIREFKQLATTPRPQLIELAVNGQFRESKLRSILWRYALGIFHNPTNSDEDHQPPIATVCERWTSELVHTRSSYDEEKSRQIINPTGMGESTDDLMVNNPLSTVEDSKWALYHKDQELLEIIKVDLQRLYPNGCDEYFQDPHLNQVMSNILFVWAKLHPITSYRQGMHELLAPIVFVLYHDLDAFLIAKEFRSHSTVGDHHDEGHEKRAVEDCLTAIYDRQYLEHDAYDMFSSLMVYVEALFLPDTETNKSSIIAAASAPLPADASDVIQSPNSTNPASSAPSRRKTKRVSPVLMLCAKIQHQMLFEVDPGLHKRLVKLHIEPQIYGLRMTRLMFSREFHIEDVLVIWDSIFFKAFNNNDIDPRDNFVLTGIACVAVSMIVFVKAQLTRGDANDALTCLMKYPNVDDVSMIIRQAQVISVHGKIPSFAQPNGARPKATSKQSPPSKADSSGKRVPEWLLNSSSSSTTNNNSNAMNNPSKEPTRVKSFFKDMTTNGKNLLKKRSSVAESKPPSPPPNEQESKAARMGDKLEAIVKKLEVAVDGLFSDMDPLTRQAGSTVEKENEMMQQLAQMKQVRDVLMGRIDEGDLCWL